MPTEKKKAIVADLLEMLSRSSIIILTDYRGLNVTQITAIRRSVERVGGSYHVVKNTLLNLALEETDIQGVGPYLEGPVAVAFGFGEAVPLAQTLDQQTKEFPTLMIKGGWMPGQVMTAAHVTTLATLPPRPVLLGQVAGTIQAPMNSLVNGLATVLRQLIYALRQRAEGGSEAEAAA